MPNWCSQDLFITGPKKDREAFIKAITVDKRDDGAEEIQYKILDTQFPMPQEFKGIHSGFCKIDDAEVHEWREVDGKSVAISDEERAQLIKNYGASNWYDWAHRNWGTKWGDCETLLIDTNARRTRFELESAWSPISDGLAKVSKLWPTLKFTLKYYEQGAGYAGVDIIQDGWVDTVEQNDNYRGGRGG